MADEERSRRALSEVVALGLRASHRSRVWPASGSDVLGCLLLASRGSRARAVGSPARHATRAGGAHADAARAGGRGDLRLRTVALHCRLLRAPSAGLISQNAG